MESKKAIERLSEIASGYSIPVLLSNCIGISGGYDCAGNTAAWNRQGKIIGQLDSDKEGILIFNTETEEIHLATCN